MSCIIAFYEAKKLGDPRCSQTDDPNVIHNENRRPILLAEYSSMSPEVFTLISDVLHSLKLIFDVRNNATAKLDSLRKQLGKNVLPFRACHIE
jgi:hypothetical protein